MPDATPTAAPAAAQPTVNPTVEASTFTSEPIKVAPEPEVKAEPEKKPEPEPLVTALAKASAGERAAKKAAADLQTKIAELTAKLEKADEGSAKAAKLEAELAELFDKPRLYLKKYQPKDKEKNDGFREILDGFGQDEPVTDPRIDALLEKDAARDAAEVKAKEDAEKAKKETEDREYEETNKRATANIQKMMAEEGAKPDATGVERWAIVGLDEGAANRAREEVIKYVTDKKIDATPEQAKDLICQALDQMEKDARAEIEKRAAKLNRLKPSNNEASYSDSSQMQHPTATERPPVNTTIANLRESPLPSPTKQATAHGFTGGLR